MRLQESCEHLNAGHVKSRNRLGQGFDHCKNGLVVLIHMHGLAQITIGLDHSVKALACVATLRADTTAKEVRGAIKHKVKVFGGHALDSGRENDATKARALSSAVGLRLNVGAGFCAWRNLAMDSHCSRLRDDLKPTG